MNNSDIEFIKRFEDKVESTIKEYNLLNPDDKVIVAVSGGKDSTTALYLLHKMGYNVEGLVIDQLLGEYSKRNLGNIREFCRVNGIRLHVVYMKDEYGCSVCYMKSVLDGKGIKLNSCTICGVIRRSILNEKGRELGATKIATGHNLDDEAQTVFMNLVRGDLDRSARLGPIAGVVRDKKFIPRVKPLYFCLESEVERYSRINGFPVVYEPCPCSIDSYRTSIKKILSRIESKEPGSKESIIKTFLGIRPLLKENQVSGKILECSVCGEPSSNDVCKKCVILNNFRCES